MLLLSALIFTISAAFLPYQLELLEVLAVLCLAGHDVCLFLNKKDDNKILPIGVSFATCVSVLLLLIFMSTHDLDLYYAVERTNLLIIAVSAFFRIFDPKLSFTAITVIALSFAALGLYSDFRYGRTIMASVAEFVIGSNKTEDEKVLETFRLLTEAGETAFAADHSAFNKTLTEDTFNDMQVLYLNADSDYDNVVFYIHGGYYVYQMGSEQMSFVNRIANNTNSMIVMPIYPLAPFNTVTDSYETMMQLYEKVRTENEGCKIILMGDSAGGGYSLALAEGMTEYGLEQPDELILLSPWVDVSMNNPGIADYISDDPMLTVTMGRMSGEAWAGELPPEDWHVSPINGDMSELHNVTIFVGTRELFYPDDTLLYEKLRNNPRVRLYIGSGQNHVYPVYPTLEGRIATERIMKIIQRK